MSQIMGVAELLRLKREDCKRTKHDSQFSQWKVLVGPSDWEDHSRGKEGADRYRLHNLPTTSAPGVYELGIAILRPHLGRTADKLHSDDVVVTYLGQADTVRTRLQRYGRSGAHLNNANDGPGCFDDVLGRGYSIVFRWAPMKNKADALKTESKLLDTFDYAWNKGSNGNRRHDDVLQKLRRVASKPIQLPRTIRKLVHISQKPAGIKIKAISLPPQQNKSSTYVDMERHNFFSQVFKFTKSQPRLVLDRHGADEDHKATCGVALGDGFVCRRPPVEGRKRCAEHKGMKIRVSIPTLAVEGKSRVGNAEPVKLPFVVRPVSEGISLICGVILDDGSLCRRPPVQGNKRCEEHKWRKVCGSKFELTGTSKYVHDTMFDSSAHSTLYSPLYRPGKVQTQSFSEGSTANPCYDTMCGVEFGNGTFCCRQPVKGNKRCEEHKGLKINRNKAKSAAQDKAHVHDTGTKSLTLNNQNSSKSVCGAPTADGSQCNRRVKGNARCWQHSGQVFDTGSTISKCNDWNGNQNNISSACGAATLDGGYCRREVKGDTRCWQHSWQAIDSGSMFSKYNNDWNYGGTSVCGAPTRNGSYCRRAVKGGGRCWQH